MFGAGLIEQIPDKRSLRTRSTTHRRRDSGIRGRPNMSSPAMISGQANNNGNDGTVARFGWKAQNKSLLLFSGEAYNVEMGITNELFQTERDETRHASLRPFPTTSPTPRARRLLSDQSDRKVCILHALPRAADAFARYAGRSRFDRARPKPVQQYRVRALSYAHAQYRQWHGRCFALSACESVLRPVGP